MKITGVKLQQRLRELETERETANLKFTASLLLNDVQQTEYLAKKYYEVEAHIAQLQALQAAYNMSLEVVVEGQRMPLHEAVKRVGGVARMEKLWRHAARTAAHMKEVGLHGVNETVQFSNALRAAISVANSTEVEITEEFARLF